MADYSVFVAANKTLSVGVVDRIIFDASGELWALNRSAGEIWARIGSGSTADPVAAGDDCIPITGVPEKIGVVSHDSVVKVLGTTENYSLWVVPQ